MSRLCVRSENARALLMSQIPPDQYRERFETALKQYFIVCYCDLVRH